MLTVSYSVNGQKLEKKNLKELKIDKKDYIDYVESIKKNTNFDK